MEQLKGRRRRIVDKVRAAAAVGRAKARDWNPGLGQSSGRLGPKAFQGLFRNEIPDFNDIGPGAQVIDMPAKLFLSLQMTPQPLKKTAVATANIEIIAGGKGKSPQLAHSDSGLLIQCQEQGIGASFLSHVLILLLHRNKGQDFVLPGWRRGAKLDKVGEAAMSRRFEFVVADGGIRLDRFISEHCSISRSYAQKLIDEGYVTIDGHQAKAGQRLSPGTRVLATIPSPIPLSLAPEEIPLKIVYQDSDLLVVDKPAGLAVHPAPGHPSHTLVNAILALCPDLAGIGGSLRPGLVHRLDKDTSGLMVVAKSNLAQMSLSDQLKNRTVVKKYLALVCGHLAPKQGAIEAPIGRHPRDRKRMAVVSGGREARTRYQVLEYVKDPTLVQVQPETGRTHQIRVHLSAIGHPLFGDPVYGKRSALLGRQFLHANYLGFKLPGSGEFVEFHSELPAELEQVLEHIRRGL